MPAISNGFRLLQSSYAKGINKEQARIGNLFQQKTKAKFVGDELAYAITAFHYIHQNPSAAGLVNGSDIWEYSSLKDYAGLRNGTLCDKGLALQLLGIEAIQILNLDLSDDVVKNIF